MSLEHIKAQIDNALDMIQIITEDVEANFIEPHINNAVTARAQLTVLSLSVVSAYLRHISEEAQRFNEEQNQISVQPDARLCS